jgi:AcrR family transcriptional regulator
MGRKKKGAEPDTISRERWLDVARSVLIREGISGVKVNRLAKKLGVTRGGFYWRFKNLADLQDALVEDWRASNTVPFLAALNGPGDPPHRLKAGFRLWVEEKDFDPSYDAAVRAWARVSRKVASAVHAIDDQRIDALKSLFVDSGYGEDESFIRARITYFHQVGYYAMGVRESSKRRYELIELYYRVLSGFKNGGSFED